MSSHPVTDYIGVATWRFVEDKFSDYGKECLTKIIRFVEDECIPAEETFHAQISKDPVKRWGSIPPVLEDLKRKARELGLWNFFLSQNHYPKFGCPLTVLEYAVCCEILGRCYLLAPQALNCSAPDTGNMEILAKFGNEAQQEKWLKPLMDGKIRSCFSATEKGKCSSDAANISATMVQEGDEIVINAHKHWISNALDPRTAVHLLLGKSHPDNPPHKQQSLVIIPADSPGITIVRPQNFFGYDDAPEGHCEVIYKDVRVPIGNLMLGWGRGFEIMQGRMGPARTHLCMRAVGMAERCLDFMLHRATDPARVAFGKQLYEHQTVATEIAQSRIEIDQIRFIVLNAAHAVDSGDTKTAMKEVTEAKIATFKAVLRVIDRAIQVHGGDGMDTIYPMAFYAAMNRVFRIADGPDEVHLRQLSKIELKRAPLARARIEEARKKSKALLVQYGVAKL